MIKPLLPLRLQDIDRESLRVYLKDTWSLSDMLYNSIVNEEAMYSALDPLRHPLIFYLGHNPVFYINKLRQAGLLLNPIDSHFESIFASGVDPASADEIDKSIQWPKLEKVKKYIETVRQTLIHSIDLMDLCDISFDSKVWSLLMSMEHERIHFETSSVLIRQCPINFLKKPEGVRYASCSDNVPDLEFIQFKGQDVRLGNNDNYPYYGWDNEYGDLVVATKTFEISNRLISNKEFLGFVQDYGYKKEKYWSKDGWRWKSRAKKTSPLFWIESNGQYKYRAMYDVIDLPLDWPAEVNYHEAKAFCAWKDWQYRLPVEAEYQVMQNHCLNANSEEPFNQNLNLNIANFSPTSVVRHNIHGVYDLFGNVWQWLEDEFYPLPGFESHSLYEDFSKPYFTKEHKMIKGGSWATTGTAMCKSYRLWFRKHFYQHAGFRIIRELNL